MKYLNLAILCLLLVFNKLVFAYEVDTHARITEEVYNRFISSAGSSVLKDYGLLDKLTESVPFGERYYKIMADGSFEEREPKTENIRHMPQPTEYLTIKGWMMQGNIFEDNEDFTDFFDVIDDDEQMRFLNHFYNPISGLGLIFPGYHYSAPDWALGVVDSFSYPNDIDEKRDNRFSVADAYAALYRALTNHNHTGEELVLNTQHERDKYWAALFKNMGHVIHLVQDMAQPQHTRNELHGPLPGIGNSKSHPSGGFEFYTNVRATQLRACYIIGAEYTECVEPADPIKLTGYPMPNFNHFSSYFHTISSDINIRKGLADYSNRNFFTQNHNVGNAEFTSPSNNVFDTNEYTHLDATEQILDGIHYQTEKILRVANDAVYPDKSEPVKVTTLASTWDNGNHINKYILDDTNYNSIADNLVPRAVGYSAGFINHFFRGRLTLVGNQQTNEGIVFRLKNTSLNSFEMKDGYIRVFYDSLVPSDYGKETRVVFLTEQYISLLASEGSVDLNFVLPADADFENGKLRFVFNGKIGNEYGIAAILTDIPLSGVLVNPNRITTGGKSGTRLLYANGLSWRVAQEANAFSAGNIDWKGWYVSDYQPTQVLTWRGPKSRYFGENQSNYNVFSSSIYKQGEILARTPYRVFGAALIVDDAGDQWIVAICNNEYDDIVYIRPNIRSYSSALYDAISNPNGWIEVGRFEPRGEEQPIDRPWFFNGPGTEAQTMRKTNELSSGLTRLKIDIDINNKNAVINREGNLAGIVTEVQSAASTNEEGWGTSSSQETRNGAYYVAVDYGGSRGEDVLLATVQDNNTSTNNKYVDSTAVRETRETTGKRIMSWPGGSLVLDDNTYRYHRGEESENISGSSVYQKRMRRALTFLDMRHNLVSYDYRETSLNAYPVDVDVGYIINGNQTDSRKTVVRIGESSFEKNYYDASSGDVSQDIFNFYWYYTPNLNSSSSWTYSNGFDFVGHKDLIGSWVVDKGGEVFVSQAVKDQSGIIVDNINYFSGQDIYNLLDIVNNPDVKFYPVYLY